MLIQFCIIGLTGTLSSSSFPYWKNSEVPKQSSYVTTQKLLHNWTWLKCTTLIQAKVKLLMSIVAAEQLPFYTPLEEIALYKRWSDLLKWQIEWVKRYSPCCTTSNEETNLGNKPGLCLSMASVMQFCFVLCVALSHTRGVSEAEFSLYWWFHYNIDLYKTFYAVHLLCEA